MRRAAAFIAASLIAMSASAQNVRIEIGLGGVYPAGEWTACRISGLDNVPDGTVVTLRVSDMFERELRVRGGAAEGLILIPDESPTLEVDVAHRGRARLAPEDLRRLVCVKDRLPVLFIGDNAPVPETVERVLNAGAIAPIRMAAEEFLAHDMGDFDWVDVFVLGAWNPGIAARINEHLPRFSNAVLVSQPHTVESLRLKLDFEPVTMSESVHNRELAPMLPLPRGAVRPDLYEIFGPPRWPRSARSDVGLYILGVLAVFALWAVFPRRRGKWFGASIVSVVWASLFFSFMSSVHVSLRSESVSLFERVAKERLGVQTDLTSRLHLRGGPGEPEPIALKTLDAVPVAFSRGAWVESPLVMDAQGSLSRRPLVPSRDVVVSRRMGNVRRVDRTCVTDGEFVWAEGAGPESARRPLAEFIEERHHPDARAEELRDAMLRWWRKTRFRGGTCNFGWVDGPEDRRGLHAGTLVVTQVDSPIPAPP